MRSKLLVCSQLVFLGFTNIEAMDWDRIVASSGANWRRDGMQLLTQQTRPGDVPTLQQISQSGVQSQERKKADGSRTQMISQQEEKSLGSSKAHQISKEKLEKSGEKIQKRRSRIPNEKRENDERSGSASKKAISNEEMKKGAYLERERQAEEKARLETEARREYYWNVAKFVGGAITTVGLATAFVWFAPKIPLVGSALSFLGGMLGLGSHGGNSTKTDNVYDLRNYGNMTYGGNFTSKVHYDSNFTNLTNIEQFNQTNILNSSGNFTSSANVTSPSNALSTDVAVKDAGKYVPTCPAYREIIYSRLLGDNPEKYSDVSIRDNGIELRPVAQHGDVITISSNYYRGRMSTDINNAKALPGKDNNDRIPRKLNRRLERAFTESQLGYEYARKYISEQESIINEQQSTINGQKSVIKRLSHDDSTIVGQRQQIQALTEGWKQTNNTVIEKSNQIERLSSELGHARSNITAKDQEISRLSEIVKGTNSSDMEKQKEINRLTAGWQQTNNTIAEQNNQIAELNKELNYARGNITAHVQETERIRKELEELKKKEQIEGQDD